LSGKILPQQFIRLGQGLVARSFVVADGGFESGVILSMDGVVLANDARKLNSLRLFVSEEIEDAGQLCCRERC
jgi:hypothetical protein